MALLPELPPFSFPCSQLILATVQQLKSHNHLLTFSLCLAFCFSGVQVEIFSNPRLEQEIIYRFTYFHQHLNRFDITRPSC